MHNSVSDLHITLTTNCFHIINSFQASPLSVSKGTIAVETCAHQPWSFHGHFTSDTYEGRGNGCTPQFCAYATLIHEASGAAPHIGLCIGNTARFFHSLDNTLVTLSERAEAAQNKLVSPFWPGASHFVFQSARETNKINSQESPKYKLFSQFGQCAGMAMSKDSPLITPLTLSSTSNQKTPAGNAPAVLPAPDG